MGSSNSRCKVQRSAFLSLVVMETISQTQVIAARELQRRRAARSNLDDWARVNGFEPARHHRLLNAKLEAVARGEIRRLMVFMPPGSAKSTYCSVLFPPWFLAQREDSSILTASHSFDLAEAFGRKARNIVDDHKNVLGYELRKDSQSASEWATTNKSIFFCAGVGGKIAGRRADLALIDDPIGSREDAQSKVIRDKTWAWYQDDFRTRLKPGARVILVQTRWHEEDLAGKLLQSEGGEWEIVNLPMIAKENDILGRQVGEMLWPEYFDANLLADAQKNTSTFSALYQQDPTPEDGDYFKREHIEKNAYEPEELPPLSELRIYCTSDHALSTREQADYSCFMAGGVDSRGVLWILPDLVWDKFDTLTAARYMIDMMRRLNPMTWWAEADKIGKSIGPFLKKMMREEMVFCYIDEIRPSKDKPTRAQSIRGRMQAGMVRLPRRATWYERALSQLLKFPMGGKDDFVDPLAYFGLGLDRMVAGQGPKPAEDPAKYLNSPPLTLRRLKYLSRREERRKAAILRDM